MKIRPAVVFLCISCAAFAQTKNDTLETHSKYEKGNWHTALTLNLEKEKEKNINDLFFDVQDHENTNFSISSAAGYFIKKEMSLGLKISYLKRKRDLKYLNSEEELARFQEASSSIIFTPFLRNYFPLGKKKKVSFFNETDISFGFGTTITRHTKSSTDISKLYSKDFSLNIGLAPGITFLLVRGFSFETSINLLGLKYDRHKITENNLPSGKQEDIKFDFDINLLRLNFSLAYYF